MQFIKLNRVCERSLTCVSPCGLTIVFMCGSSLSFKLVSEPWGCNCCDSLWFVCEFEWKKKGDIQQTLVQMTNWPKYASKNWCITRDLLPSNVTLVYRELVYNSVEGVQSLHEHDVKIAVVSDQSLRLQRDIQSHPILWLVWRSSPTPCIIRFSNQRHHSSVRYWPEPKHKSRAALKFFVRTISPRIERDMLC